MQAFNAKPTAERIQAVGARALVPTPALEAAREVLKAGIARNFDSQGATFGGPWPPLAASTLERKGRQGLPSEILKARGVLARNAARGGKKGSVGKYSVRVGIATWYAQFAQTKNPRRVIVGVDQKDFGKIIGLLYRWIGEGAIGKR